MTDDAKAYGQIFRSTSIIGGTQALNYLIGLARVKIVALLIGPAGVGLFGVYASALAFVSVFTDFGVSPSAVREIARAGADADPRALSRSVAILRRICWIIGAVGWAATALFSHALSELATGTGEHAAALAALGVTLLFATLNVGQISLLQALRRTEDFARAQLVGTILGCLLTILTVFALGEEGIAWAIIATSLATLACGYWFARRVDIIPLSVSLHEVWVGFRSVVFELGLAFTWNGVLTAGLDMFIRSQITHQLGMEQAGNYQAASAVSGVLASVVIAAMASDFYPQLVSVIGDRDRAVRIINQQTEIGVLLALPGLSALCAFAPHITVALYSHKFSTAAEMLPWMGIGVFFRIACWPIWYTQLAKGASAWFAATQTVIVGLQASLTVWFMYAFGVVGAAYAIALSAFFHTLIMLFVAKELVGAAWLVKTQKLIAAAAVFLGVAMCSRLLLGGVLAEIGGAAACAAASVYSLREIAARLGEHRIVSMLRRIPGVSLLLIDISARRSQEGA
jgi:enterobacterial common antigen flippase